MVTSPSSDESLSLTRRRALIGVGGTLVAGLAGCLGPNIPDDAVEEMPAPTRGDADAPVTVQVFEDFGCPHCKSFNEQIAPQIFENYVDTGDVRYEWHDYPLPVTEWSWPAAMSARSVQDRADDPETFWRYERMLFDNQSKLSHDLFREAANELGLDGNGVVEDTRNNKYRPVVQADYDLGQEMGVNSTPSVFVEGNLVQPNSAQGYYQAIAAAIEQHL